MILVLRASPQQEGQLDQLLAEQQDPFSQNYHAWITPERFGARFGVAAEDLANVTRWLRSNGLAVGSPLKGGLAVEFSGTVAQMEMAFGCEFHTYELEGETRLALASDLLVPASLAPALAGLGSSGDFRADPQLAFTEASGKRPAPWARSALSLFPIDFAAVYGLAPLWNEGTDGAGQTIAVAARSNIDLADVRRFRTLSGLPAKDPEIIVNGPDPGVLGGAETTEATLDVEWAGAGAPQAHVKFVVSQSTATTDGVFLSAQYIVENNLAQVVSLSFGACEEFLGSMNQAYSNLWRQAAAQGMTVIVAAGDSGAAGCDPVTALAARNGLGVNGLASSPYVTAVGGSQFAASESETPPTFEPSRSLGNGYLKELVWNESESGVSLAAGGGGVSKLYGVPTWQAGVTPGPLSTQTAGRMLPDVAVAASPRRGYVIVQGGAILVVGGTSAAAPAFAGIIALMNQRSGGAGGNANPRLYAAASLFPDSFHDLSTGNNAVPCSATTPGCVVSATTPTQSGNTQGYTAAAGYDLASGLGSVDAYRLARHWADVTPPPAIISTSPSTLRAGATQELTLLGAGFGPGTNVALFVAGAWSSVPFQPSNANEIRVSTFVPNALTTLLVRVSSAAGQGTFSIPVLSAPPPSVISVDPTALVATGGTQAITLLGTGFQQGMTILTAQGDTSIEVPITQVSVQDASRAIVDANVGSAGGVWKFRAMNPDGQTSAAVSITVVLPAVRPSISAISPARVVGTSSPQTFVLSGTGFQVGQALSVYAGASGTAGIAQITSATATEIHFQLVVGTAARTWAIQVANPDGTLSNAVTLEVDAPGSVFPPPTITSVDPSVVTGAGFYQLLQIAGTGFQPGAKIELSMGGAAAVDVPPSNVVVSGAEQIQALFRFGTGQTTWTLRVSNPDGQISNPAPIVVR